MTTDRMLCCNTFMLRTGNYFHCCICGQKTLKLNAKPLELKIPKTRVICVIPARLPSSRLPGKVLLSETGKPLIQYAWEAAQESKMIHGVTIAAECNEIVDAAEAFGARAWKSQNLHNCGTSRVAEVASYIDGSHPDRQADLIINLQADEPDITGEDLDQLVQAMLDRPDVQMGTLAWETTDPAIAHSPDKCKVVTHPNGRAIYFSRSPVPCNLKQGRWQIHAGVYAFRRRFLLEFAKSPSSYLELAEGLEQLRAVEMGAQIHVERLSHPTRGIDTPEDYAAFVSATADMVNTGA